MKKKRINKIILTTGLIMFFLLTIVVAGRTIEKFPNFCSSCHEMQAPYDRWLSSGAAEKHEDCIQCHSGPGFTGVIGAEMRGLKQVYKHIIRDFDGVENITNVVPDKFCVKCHQTKEMDEEHDKHKINRENKRCSVCHNHKGNNKFFVEMD